MTLTDRAYENLVCKVDAEDPVPRVSHYNYSFIIQVPY